MYFESILKATQKQLKILLIQELKKSNYKVISKNGFIYAKGSVPILLVAHMDTVHKSQPDIICYSEDKRYIMSPYGIGGDDRCGIYMILEIIKLHRCHVLFTEDEEVGGLGAKAFVKSNIQPEINYIIELDRKGSNDCVFYNDSNQDFIQFIENFGFKTATGSFSDISIIAPALGISGANLSCGYFFAHTNHELIDTKVMEKNIERVINLIQSPASVFRFTDTFYDMGEYLYAIETMIVEDGYVILKNGIIADGEDYCIDKNKNVYWYDYLSDTAIQVSGQAFSSNGLPLAFDENKAELTLIENKFTL